jgi:DNA helicase-2/ATP-dependent DNA helicase PcrA
VLGARALTEHAEVRDLLCHLRLVCNRRDRLAFARALQAPPRGLGPAAVAALVRHADREHGGDLLASLRDARRAERLREGQRRTAAELGVALTKLAAEPESRPVSATVVEAVLASGLARSLAHKQGAEAERKLERLRAVVRTAREYERTTADGSLSDFLSHAALADGGEEQERGGRVTLATIHAAKGLEFRCVRLLGLEEGLLPHHRALMASDREEERRLCYVAMTRARERLVLSWSSARDGRANRTGSPFLLESGR